jgi:putative tryptophan/tyrosine transport system substrate-binding protein
MVPINPWNFGIHTGRMAKPRNPSICRSRKRLKYELAINLKTAKALGLLLPETLLAVADEVV